MEEQGFVSVLIPLSGRNVGKASREASWLFCPEEEWESPNGIFNVWNWTRKCNSKTLLTCSKLLQSLDQAGLDQSKPLWNVEVVASSAPSVSLHGSASAALLCLILAFTNLSLGRWGCKKSQDGPSFFSLFPSCLQPELSSTFLDTHHELVSWIQSTSRIMATGYGKA